MPDYVVGKVGDALNGERKAINGSRILILGVAYKRDVSDLRESPALDVIHLLRQRGAEVVYSDPHVAEVKMDGYALSSIELTPALLESVDCVVIVTDHTAFDWEWIGAGARLIVDTRNAIRAGSRARVVRL
jgi:UDP-N-acetyl-D-glucosamine dehydrogenase